MNPLQQPVLFLSHGSPLYAVEAHPVTEAWAALGQQLAPRAVLMVSAHWETEHPAVTLAAHPATIHDFGGFPAPLYQLRYPAPGAPTVAATVLAQLARAGIVAEGDPQRGLDHGAWVPLMHLFPQALVPVLQLSVQPRLDARHHLQLGTALAPLAAQGVLIVGSGHMTHNLGDWFRHGNSPAPLPYAQAFRDWVDSRIMTGQIDALLDWSAAAPEARRAHPTPEHFLPLFVALGAAGHQAKVERLFSGFEGSALALDAYRFDPETH